MKKRVFIILISLGIVAQLSVLGWMLISRELTLRYGESCLLQAAPVDPMDPFRGRYIALNYQTLNNMVVEGEREKWPRGKVCWITFKTNENGVAEFDTLLLQKPDTGLYVKTHVRYSAPQMQPTDPPVTNSYGIVQKERTGKLTIVCSDLPFKRYYMPEKLAPEVEKAYGKALRNAGDQKVFAKIRFRKGQAVFEELLFDSQPVREYLKGQVSSK